MEDTDKEYQFQIFIFLNTTHWDSYCLAAAVSGVIGSIQQIKLEKHQFMIAFLGMNSL